MEKLIIKEVSALLAKVDRKEHEKLIAAIEGAHRIFLAGTGRSGLMVRAFAIRLRHLGLESHVIGDTICPPIGKGDLMIAVSRSGTRSLLLDYITSAARHHAETISITSEESNPLALESKQKIIIPAKDSAQFGGSLFEQAVLLFLDTAADIYKKKHEIPDTEMWQRHSNIE